MQDLLQQKITLEKHKFEVIYLKNLWAMTLGGAGLFVVFFQLLITGSVQEKFIPFVYRLTVAVGLLVIFMFIIYTINRINYVKKLDQLFEELRQTNQQHK